MVTAVESPPWVEMAVYHLRAYVMVEVQEVDLSCSTLCLTWWHQCFAGLTWGTMRLLEALEAVEVVEVPLICLDLHCQCRLQSPVLSPSLVCPQCTAL
jgi:hypothetical protein